MSSDLLWSAFNLPPNARSREYGLTDPATTSTLNVEGHIRTMVDYWMGHTDFDDAVRRGDLTVEGPPRLVRAIPTWFRRSLFAPVELPAST